MQILKMKKHAGQPPIQMAEAAPISAVAAKINMEFFEELALNMVPQPDPDCGRGMLMTSFHPQEGLNRRTPLPSQQVQADHQVHT